MCTNLEGLLQNWDLCAIDKKKTVLEKPKIAGSECDYVDTPICELFCNIAICVQFLKKHILKA